MLRIAGWPHSAQRILRLARRVASDAGSVRGELATAGNLLLASAGATTALRAAEESTSIAERCLAWGMLSDGVAQALGAAVRWMQTSHQDRAVQLLTRASDVPRISPESEKEPSQDGDIDGGGGGMTCAIGSPLRSTRMGFRVRLTRSRRAKQVALN